MQWNDGGMMREKEPKVKRDFGRGIEKGALHEPFICPSQHYITQMFRH